MHALVSYVLEQAAGRMQARVQSEASGPPTPQKLKVHTLQVARCEP